MTDSTPDRSTPAPLARVGPAATLALLATAALGLVAAGDRIPGPPLDPTRLVTWFETDDAAMAVAGALRVLALLAVAYLAGLVVVGALLRAGRHDPALASRLPLWLGRRVLEHALGVSLVAGVGLTLAPLGATADTGPADGGSAPVDEHTEQPPDTIVMVPLDGESGVSSSTSTTTESRAARVDPLPTPRPAPTSTTPAEERSAPGEPTATMTSLDDPDASDHDDPTPDRPSTPAPDDTGTTAPPPTGDDSLDADATTTWQVELGDHLWAIAAETLADQGAPADDSSVLDYWTRLLDANRRRLVDPDNPDLLFPGQVLVLPALNAG